MNYRIVVTDVTDYGLLHCIAGWDLQRQCMIRPEPAPAGFWHGNFVGPNHVFGPGHIVEFEGAPVPDQSYPHATEDVVVKIPTLNRVGVVNAAQLPNVLPGSVAANLADIFEGAMRISGTSAHVASGVQCRSLGAINVNRDAIVFSEGNRDGKRKLRVKYQTGNVTLNVGVTATDVRSVFMNEGLAAVAAKYPQDRQLHLRIGLSRPFQARPNECYVQVNGIYSIG
jgi:hypothetical protein